MKKLQKAAVVTAAVMSVAAVFSGCNHTSSATQDNAADPTSQIVVAYVTWLEQLRSRSEPHDAYQLCLRQGSAYV